jgi:rare lipoprotein A
MSIFRLLGALLVIASAVVTLAALVAVATIPAHAAECGRASWYGTESGSRTASGERFDPSGLTIAMRSRDFGRRFRVTFGGRSVVVRHTDFGPASWTGRRYDISRGAAVRLGMIRRGVGLVCVARL